MRNIKQIMLVISGVALALFVIRDPTSWLSVAVLIQCLAVPVVFLMFAIPMILLSWWEAGSLPRWPISSDDPPPPHGLRKGQLVLLPDRTRGRVTDFSPFRPLTALEPVPPRA